MKSVQIPESLFQELLDYFGNLDFRCILLDLFDPKHVVNYDEIGYQLRQKYSQICKREKFAAYKRAADPAEREALRRQYLDSAGIAPDFRTSEEKPEDLL